MDYNHGEADTLGPEELIEFAENVCGYGLWEEIIPYLEFERKANKNVMMNSVYAEAIQICNDKLSKYREEVNQ